MREDLKPLYNVSYTLQLKIYDENIALKKEFPHWNTPNDLRHTIISVCALTIANFVSNLHMAEETILLKDHSWLKKMWSNANEDSMISLVEYYKTNLSNTTFIVFFSLIESEIRQIARHVLATDKIEENFGKLHKDLFDKLGMEKDNELLTFTRYLRNSMHTNMIFVKSDKKNRQATFKGERYEFVHGQIIPYKANDMFMSVMDEMFDVVVRLVRHPQVCNVKTMTQFY